MRDETFVKCLTSLWMFSTRQTQPIIQVRRSESHWSVFLDWFIGKSLYPTGSKIIKGFIAVTICQSDGAFDCEADAFSK